MPSATSGRRAEKFLRTFFVFPNKQRGTVGNKRDLQNQGARNRALVTGTLTSWSIGIGNAGSTRHCGIGPGLQEKCRAGCLTAGADTEKDGPFPALGGSEDRNRLASLEPGWRNSAEREARFGFVQKSRRTVAARLHDGNRKHHYNCLSQLPTQ
jgi:hypothetical protein